MVEKTVVYENVLGDSGLGDNVLGDLCFSTEDALNIQFQFLSKNNRSKYMSIFGADEELQRL